MGSIVRLVNAKATCCIFACHHMRLRTSNGKAVSPKHHVFPVDMRCSNPFVTRVYIRKDVGMQGATKKANQLDHRLVRTLRLNGSPESRRMRKQPGGPGSTFQKLTRVPLSKSDSAR